MWELCKLATTTDKTEIYHFFQNNELTKISQTEVLDYLHTVAHSIGPDKLGFDLMEIGCKSICSGTVIGWHLVEHRAEHIMLMGRWKSDAFITYLRHHVLKFCQGMWKSLIFNINSLMRIQPLEPVCGTLNSLFVASHHMVLIQWLLPWSSLLTLPSIFTRIFYSLVLRSS